MGGNTTNRIDWNIDKIHDLVTCYKQQDHEFYNPITNKILPTKQAWRSSIAVKMSYNSANLFFFLLEPPHFSKLSNIPLTIDDYNYKRYGFTKYTKLEISTKQYHKLRDYKTISNETKNKISKTLTSYYTTDAGIIDKERKSNRMQRFYKTDEGKVHKRMCCIKQSDTMKTKIRNGEFTPPITNTWTHWNALIIQDNITTKFRSSWEACFWFCNQHLEYETIRIKGNRKTYISDFYDSITNTLYEIKPCSRYNIEIDKMNTIINYCITNNINFIWINENNIENYIDKTKINTNVSAIEQYNKLKCIYDYKTKN